MTNHVQARIAALANRLRLHAIDLLNGGTNASDLRNDLNEAAALLVDLPREEEPTPLETFYRGLEASQKDLPDDALKVLHENAWALIGADPGSPVSVDHRQGCACQCCDHAEGSDCACDCHSAGKCAFHPSPVSVEPPDQIELRKFLWLRHGHSGLYGDDGEMQCGQCAELSRLYDYRRAPLADVVKAAWAAVDANALAALRAGGGLRPGEST